MRTAIEKQRLDALLRNADDLRCYELDSIADAFRIEPSLLVSNAELPYDAYRVACGHLPYDTYRMALDRYCATMTREDTLHHFRLNILLKLLPPVASQSSYKQRKDNISDSLEVSCSADSDYESIGFTEDNYKKIMSTLSACQLLQELWEEELWNGEKYHGHEIRPFTGLPGGSSPEEYGAKAANRASLTVRWDSKV